MNHFRKRRRKNLQTRFFLAYLAVALLVTAFFSILFYRYTSKILIARETKAAVDLNASFLYGAEAAVEGYEPGIHQHLLQQPGERPADRTHCIRFPASSAPWQI